MSPGKKETAPRRILIIRLTALGDVVLATPLLHSLRAAFPDAAIDWLTHEAFAPLLAADPALSRALPWRPGEPGLAARLREARYDCVLDLQNKPRTAWLRGRLGASRVVVHQKRGLGQALASLVGLEKPARGPHAVEAYLAVGERLGIAPSIRQPKIFLSEAGRAEVAALLARQRAKSLWGIAPATRWATKRWPTARFAELAASAVKEGAQILLLGGAADRAAFDEVSRGLGPALLGDTGDCSAAGLAAAVAACSVVVSNDSGPAHLAAALDRPLVVLFGPTAPGRWAPRGDRVRVLYEDLPCSPCSNHGGDRCPIGTHACLEAIPAAKAFASAFQMLQPSASACQPAKPASSELA
jgi:heptosyltransferase-2